MAKTVKKAMTRAARARREAEARQLAEVGERYRLMQAQALIDAFVAARGVHPSSIEELEAFVVDAK